MPITPFIGVRTSWLTLARNSPFALLASSAASPARLALLYIRKTNPSRPSTPTRNTLAHMVRFFSSFKRARGCASTFENTNQRSTMQPKLPSCDIRSISLLKASVSREWPGTEPVDMVT